MQSNEICDYCIHQRMPGEHCFSGTKYYCYDDATIIDGDWPALYDRFEGKDIGGNQ